MLYVSGRLSGGSGSNHAVSPGVSAKERPSRAWGEGREGEARFVVFYEGLRFWEARFVMLYEGLRLSEAHLYVFYVSGRLSGGSVSNRLVRAGGSAKERPPRAWGEGGGGGGRLDLVCFTRV